MTQPVMVIICDGLDEAFRETCYNDAVWKGENTKEGGYGYWCPQCRGVLDTRFSPGFIIWSAL